MEKLRGLLEIKGFAMLSIILFHFHGIYTDWIPTSEYFIRLVLFEPLFISNLFNLFFSQGYFGVTIFIIASGWGLGFSYRKKPVINWKSWFLRRFSKIYFEYWLILLFMLLLNIVFDRGIQLSIASLSSFILGVHGFFPWQNILDGSWWFITLILSLYTFFPLIILSFNTWGVKKTLWISLAISIGFKIISFFFLNQFHGITDYFFLRFFLSRLFEFVLGISIVFGLLSSVDRNKKILLSIVGVFLGLFLTIYPFSYNVFSQLLLGISAFFLCSEYFQNRCSAILRFYGKISYPLFLLHFSLLFLLLPRISFLENSVVEFAVYFLVSTGFAYVFSVAFSKIKLLFRKV